jgi:hypothetical protein
MAIQLPSRIPDGTRLILEGEPTANGELRVISRYLLLPSGARFDLMTPTRRRSGPAKANNKPAKEPRRRVMLKSRAA